MHHHRHRHHRHHHAQGVLVGAPLLLTLLLAAALTATATAASDNTPSNPNKKPGPNSKLSTTCYFGEPSESCIFTCSQQSMEAYCDDEKKQCACKQPDSKLETEPGTDVLESTEEAQVTDMPPTAVPTDRPQTNFKLSDLCMFGYPSPACMLNCKSKDMKGHCEDDTNLCVCRNPPLDETLTMDWFALLQGLQGSLPTGAGAGDGAHQLLDLTEGMNLDLLNLWKQMQGGDLGETDEPYEETPESDENAGEDDNNDLVYYVFDLDSLINSNDSVSANGTTAAPSSSDSNLPDVGKAIEGWEIHRVMAVITLVFIGGLVLLEISFCFKKPKTENQMQSIFPTKK